MATAIPDAIRPELTALFAESTQYADTLQRLFDASITTTDPSVPAARSHSMAGFALDLRTAAQDLVVKDSDDFDTMLLYLRLAVGHKIVSDAIDFDERAKMALRQSPAVTMLTGRARAIAEENEIELGATLVALMDLSEVPQDQHAAIIKDTLLPRAKAVLDKLRMAQHIHKELDLTN